MITSVVTFVEHEGETALVIPDDLIQEFGWAVGDELEWEVHFGIDPDTCEKAARYSLTRCRAEA